jgi:hypothetical protein
MREGPTTGHRSSGRGWGRCGHRRQHFSWLFLEIMKGGNRKERDEGAKKGEQNALTFRDFK